MKEYWKAYLAGILAGFSIGLGCIVYLSIDDKIIGSALFTIGLFTICTMGLNLYTGKVCYVFDNEIAYALRLPFIWLGNLTGTGLAAGCISMTRNAGIAEKAKALCEVKLADGFVSLFFLGLLCNIIIYLAVEGYARNPHEVGKYLSLFFGVMVFILAGTEHCVADMCYFWMSGWSGRAIASILVITLGNSVSGVLFPLLRRQLR